MKDVAFGQYFPSNSVIHKMNPAIKLLLAIAFIVAVFLVRAFHFLGFGVCFAFLISVTIIAKIPFSKMLKSIKAILFFIIFSAVIQIFFNKKGTPLWENGFITDVALLNAGYIIVRITLVVLGASLLTFTTSPVELADGIEVLLTPLKLVKFPVHEFALIMSIALRFIPTLLDETDRIIKAQKARGADFESGNVFKRIKALVPVLIPLLISSFRRADELADAMDARCYAGSKNRTRYKKLEVAFKDVFAIIVMAGLITAVVFLNKFNLIPYLAAVV
ncbi:MAG: energy-coupling factor transporter transmembrane protein EcfT [Clostridia bacterium]|nr:energy-coupling factor transporter transmembrane protein EcfT [Clostridia bacterium]